MEQNSQDTKYLLWLNNTRPIFYEYLDYLPDISFNDIVCLCKKSFKIEIAQEDRHVITQAKNFARLFRRLREYEIKKDFEEIKHVYLWECFCSGLFSLAKNMHHLNNEAKKKTACCYISLCWLSMKTFLDKFNNSHNSNDLDGDSIYDIIKKQNSNIPEIVYSHASEFLKELKYVFE